MRESEWLHNDDPQALLYHVIGGSEGLEGGPGLLSDRKVFVFARVECVCSDR